MKKKILSLLTASMVLGVSLFGCGAVDEDKKTTVAATTPVETTTEEPTTTEPPFEPVELEIVMIGDMLMHMGVQNSGLLPDGTRNYDHIFANVKDDIQAADIAIANQEVSLGGEELGFSGYPCFNCAYEVGDALVNAGFNVVLHATNHTLDKGVAGVLNCINYWETNHPDVAYLGINDEEEDQDDIYVYEKDGIKVAILNYTYGTNGIMLPDNQHYFYVDYMDDNTVEEVKADIAKAKEIADFVIVCPHWGVEYTYTEVESQHVWGQIFADSGADLILGTHSHCIEPVKVIEAADGRQVVCYYSLGNFISTQQNAMNMLGAMAKVTITNDEDGNVFIKEYGVEPLVDQQIFGTQKMTVYKLSDYTSDLVYQNAILNYDGSFSMQWLVNTCMQVFGDLYVPEGEALNYVPQDSTN